MTLSRHLFLLGTFFAVAVSGCKKEEAPPAKAPEPPPVSQQAAPTPPAAPSAAAPSAPATTAPTTPAASDASGDDAAHALASKSGCLACHAVDKKVIGPAYKDVAAKYAGQPGVEATLFNSVKNGSQGKWGPIPMPPNSQVKDDDIKTLVAWVLRQK